MAIPRIISDRAATVYSIIWVIGFVLALVGSHFGKPTIKCIGFGLMTPFVLYLILMTILSTISFVRWVRGWRN